MKCSCSNKLEQSPLSPLSKRGEILHASPFIKGGLRGIVRCCLNTYFLLIFFFIFFFFPSNIFAFENQIKIFDKPILFDSEREQLTKEYIKLHYGNNIDTITITPVFIVIHATLNNDLNKTYNFFYNNKIEANLYYTEYGQLNLSSQFVIDKDGNIYRLMPETFMARHVIGLNYCSIGIENVGFGKLTEKQISANERLIRYLKNKYPTITYLIGHYEYTNFTKSRYFIENFKDYRTQKTDPDKKSMNILRHKLKDLGLGLK